MFCKLKKIATTLDIVRARFIMLLAMEGSQNSGEVAERSKAAVLKTVEGCPPSQGSNPCLSATKILFVNKLG
jgi:hypothetical protein